MSNYAFTGNFPYSVGYFSQNKAAQSVSAPVRVIYIVTWFEAQSIAWRAGYPAVSIILDPKCFANHFETVEKVW